MDLIIEAPWWSYLLFFFLIGAGLIATQPRTLSLRRLYLLPTIFTLWNIAWLVERTQEHFGLFFYWIIGVFAGGFFGWLTVRKWTVTANREKKWIHLPGSWSTLCLILLVYCVRFYFVVNYRIHPELAPRLFVPDAFISGIITGMFVGRSIELYRKYLK